MYSPSAEEIKDQAANKAHFLEDKVKYKKKKFFVIIHTKILTNIFMCILMTTKVNQSKCNLATYNEKHKDF